MSPRRSFGRAFGKWKPGIRQKNHFETTQVIGTGTESNVVVGLAVDDVTNRSTHIQNGSVLRSMIVEAVPQTIAAGKYQCLMLRIPGGVTVGGGDIANYFDATDPLTEGAIEVRQNMMGRVHTQRVVAGALIPPRFVCRWKGKKLMRDGDSIQVALLQDSGGNITWDLRVWSTVIM